MPKKTRVVVKRHTVKEYVKYVDSKKKKLH